jgi:hypothetical protein
MEKTELKKKISKKMRVKNGRVWNLEEVSSVVSFEKLLLQLTHLGKWGGGVF